MPRRRFAIITYDPDRVENLSWQAEGNDFGHIVWHTLKVGEFVGGGRGIINITVMDKMMPKPSADRT